MKAKQGDGPEVLRAFEREVALLTQGGAVPEGAADGWLKSAARRFDEGGDLFVAPVERRGARVPKVGHLTLSVDVVSLDGICLEATITVSMAVDGDDDGALNGLARTFETKAPALRYADALTILLTRVGAIGAPIGTTLH